MTIGEEFLQELTLEAVVTRRYLESVPFDKLDFRSVRRQILSPHEAKSGAIS